MPGSNAARLISENIANARNADMNVSTADWLSYSLPLKEPWQTSQGCFNQRLGRLLRLQTTDGRTGWGDCAPLPEFGVTEDSAISFAEETAYLDLTAQKAGLPLNAWLSGKPAQTNATVNGHLGAISNISDQVLFRALESGFSVLKIKFGSRPWQEEMSQLSALCAKLPADITLRLDANAAWSVADAESVLKACLRLPIEGIEEPLAQPTQEDLARLQAFVPFPLAIDESCHLINADFFDHPPVRRLILKPARHGGLLATLNIAWRAQAAGLECVVTSSLESACGLLACAHLAAAIAPTSTHGLATGSWFGTDTGVPMEMHDGRILLPTTPGLGFIKTESRKYQAD